jgi:hypothetical protein
MKRNSFDETAPVKLVVNNGDPNEPPPLPCRACANSVRPKFLMDQGGLCRSCFGAYLERGNAGLGIYRTKGPA